MDMGLNLMILTCRLLVQQHLGIWTPHHIHQLGDAGYVTYWYVFFSDFVKKNLEYMANVLNENYFLILIPGNLVDLIAI
jgi:hypothetical protein